MQMNQLARTPSQLGAILKRARRRQNKTQTTLAELAGLWQETVSKVESGSPTTRLDTLFDLLAALDLEITVRPRSRATPQDIEDIF
jgi:HTH-type transcriptional regulator/antitoxin HipB